ncbi:MAG: hypothetical protein UU47_C0001G0101 [candidate division TM6 bacterium GW2011_GWE2_41_16]|nr:MAG: hypothetical protein UU47_C0001G0101 [candidate division TM6 bacterium GW2011_GWE2_41_16]
MHIRCEFFLLGSILFLGGCAMHKPSKEVFHNQNVSAELMRTGDDTLVAPAAYNINNEKIDAHSCTTFTIRSSIDMLTTYYRDELERLGWDIESMIALPHELFVVSKKPYKRLLVHAFDGSIRPVGGRQKEDITSVRLFFS